MKFSPQVTAVAIAALVASAAAVSAQQGPDRERGGAANPPAASERAPTGPAAEHKNPTEHSSPGVSKGRSADRTTDRSAKGQSQDHNEKSRQSAESDRQKPKSTDKGRRDAAETKPSERREHDQAEGDRKDNSEARTAKQNKTRPTNERQANRSEHESSQKFRALSDDQRTKVRLSFDHGKARVTKVKFNIRIGTHVPRTVHVYPVPTAVIAVLPEYRSYRYVVVEDTICIIDPATYEIVDVIDEAPVVTGRGQVAALRLSDRDRDYIVSEIRPADFPHVDVNVRLALGAEISHGVRLERFPVAVEDRIPQLRDFRFVQVDRDVVIVQPDQRAVVDVISR